MAVEISVAGGEVPPITSVGGAQFWQLQGAMPVPDFQHQHLQNFGRNAQNWFQIRHLHHAGGNRILENLVSTVN